MDRRLRSSIGFFQMQSFVWKQLSFIIIIATVILPNGILRLIKMFQGIVQNLMFEHGAEIDFVIQRDGKLIPIEVKSADNTRAKSLKVYMETYKPDYAIKLSAKKCWL